MIIKMSVRKLVLSTTFIGFLLILFLLILIFIKNIEETRNKQVAYTKTELSQSTLSYYSDVINMLVLENHNELNKLINRIKKEENLLNMEVITGGDKYGKIISDCVPLQYNVNQYKIPTCHLIKNKVISLFQELRSGGVVLGYISKSKNLVFNYGIKSYFKGFFLLLIYISLFYFLFTWRLNRKLVNPLKFLAKNTDNVRMNGIQYEVEELSILAQSLSITYAKLKKQSKLAAIGQMSQVLAHDIRKPMSSLKSVLTMLPSKKFDDAFVNKAIKDVDHSIKSAEKMIDEVLEFTKSRSNELQNCEIKPLVHNVLVESFRYCHKQNLPYIKFKYYFNHKHQLLVDVEKINRLFSNIICNAMEAIKNSGTICIKTEEFNDPTKGLMMKIKISNDGPLITEDNLERIFEDFFTSDKNKGTGLGLSIAKKIVNEHGGNINVESKINNGENLTEFEFNLPASNTLSTQAQEDLFKDTLELQSYDKSYKEKNGESFEQLTKIKQICLNLNRKINVVIIDDEPIFRNNLRNLIVMDEDLKHLVEVYEVSNAENALELFNKMELDFAIVDIDLGEGSMSGIELGEVIKNKFYKTKYIIHSNRPKKQYEDVLNKIGAEDFVPKPLGAASLLNFLSKIKCEVNTMENQKFDKIPAKNITLFIVDDMEITRIYLEETVMEAMQGTPYNLNVHTFKTPEDVIDAVLKIRPDIVFTDYDFAKTSELNGIDLARGISMVNRRAYMYLVTNQPPEYTQRFVENLNIRSIFRPNISKEELRMLLCKDLKEYEIEQSIDPNDRKIMYEKASKLFHDVNKPIINTGMVFHSCKTRILNNKTKEAMNFFCESKPVLLEYIQEYRKNLDNFEKDINPIFKKHFKDTSKRYHTQFTQVEELLKKHSDSLNNTEEIDNILAELKKTQEDNNRYTSEVMKNI
jgi:signal transduction histidine kinase/DNA-binding NarL/FixJ family response regulator